DLDVFSSGGFTNWKAAVCDYTAIPRVDDAAVKQGLVDPVADQRGILGENEMIRTVDITDGLSSTFVLLECAGRPQLWRLRQPVPGVRVPGAGWADSQNPFPLRGTTKDCLNAPGPQGLQCTNDLQIYGFHPGGANVLMADGGVYLLYPGN